MFLSNYLKKDYTFYFIDTIASGVTNRLSRRSNVFSSRENICVKIINKNNDKYYYDRFYKMGLIVFILEKIKINLMKIYYYEIFYLSINEINKKIYNRLLSMFKTSYSD